MELTELDVNAVADWFYSSYLIYFTLISVNAKSVMNMAGAELSLDVYKLNDTPIFYI